MEAQKLAAAHYLLKAHTNADKEKALLDKHDARNPEKFSMFRWCADQTLSELQQNPNSKYYKRKVMITNIDVPTGWVSGGLMAAVAATIIGVGWLVIRLLVAALW